MKTKTCKTCSISNFMLLIFVFSFLMNISSALSTNSVVIGYYPVYRHNKLPAQKLQLQHLTHIFHSFVYPDVSGNILHSDNFIYPELNQRVHEENKKIFIALGGGAQSDDFSAMAADSTSRAKFVQGIVGFCNQHDYDGIDIDWEYPSSVTDKSNLNKFVYEINQLNPNLGLSVTLPGSNWRGQYFDFNYLSQYVEWFGCMAYDMSGTWSVTSGHNAPLYASGWNPSVKNYIDYLNVTKNVPADKIIMGIPFYGWLFESPYLGGTNYGGSSVSYIDAKTNLLNGWTYVWDDFAKVPYLINPDSTQIVSFDDVRSVGLKCDYAKERNLAGVMIWEISHDELAGDQPLLETVGQKILGSLGELTSSVEITQPESAARFFEGDSITITAFASDSIGSVSKVEFYVGSIKLGESYSAPYTHVWENVEKGFFVLKVLAYNENGIATPSERVYILVQGAMSEQTPFAGVPTVIPGIIEAEDFDEGGNGVSYYDTTPGNSGASYRTDEDVDIEPCSEGGFNVGWIVTDEWLEYTIVIDSTGFYDINFSVASTMDGGSFHLELDGTDVTGMITSPNTGAWTVFTTITKTDVELFAGEYILRFYVEQGNFNIHNMIFNYQGTTGIAENSGEIKNFNLYNNYPNPFNPQTNIRFEIPYNAYTEVAVYDLRGRKVKTLLSKNLISGTHTVFWNGTNSLNRPVASGLYFCYLRVDDLTAVTQMVLVR